MGLAREHGQQGAEGERPELSEAAARTMLLSLIPLGLPCRGSKAAAKRERQGGPQPIQSQREKARGKQELSQASLQFAEKAERAAPPCSAASRAYRSCGRASSRGRQGKSTALQ